MQRVWRPGTGDLVQTRESPWILAGDPSLATVCRGLKWFKPQTRWNDFAKTCQNEGIVVVLQVRCLLLFFLLSPDGLEWADHPATKLTPSHRSVTDPTGMTMAADMARKRSPWVLLDLEMDWAKNRPIAGWDNSSVGRVSLMCFDCHDHPWSICVHDVAGQPWMTSTFCQYDTKSLDWLLFVDFLRTAILFQRSWEHIVFQYQLLQKPAIQDPFETWTILREFVLFLSSPSVCRIWQHFLYTDLENKWKQRDCNRPMHFWCRQTSSHWRSCRHWDED